MPTKTTGALGYSGADKVVRAPSLIPQVQPWIGNEESAAVLDVFERNWLTEGPACREFADRLNELVGSEYGVFAPNGTMALALGLLALGVGPGDEVIVPDTTFIASATAVILTGASPVFADVEPDTFQIDTSRAGHLVSSSTRAIMPVHLYGTACNMNAVQEFASHHGLKVIEDAAQSIGVYYDGRHTGAIGDVGCFSFFADKTITTGEGGYVTCRDEATFDRLRFLRNQGRLDRGSFIHPMVGYNFRITDMQAAVGLAQIDKLDRIVSRKLELLEHYRRRLDLIPQVRVLGAQELSTFVPFRCVLIAERAHELMEHLTVAGIQTRTFFYPLHRQPCFAHGRYGSTDDADYPNSSFGFEHGVCLPIFPALTFEQVEMITGSIADFYDAS